MSATTKIIWVNIIVLLLYAAGINLLILQSKAESVDALSEYVDDSPGIEFLYTGPMLRLTFLYVIGAGLHFLGNLMAALLSFVADRRSLVKDFLFSSGGALMFGAILCIINLILYDLYTVFIHPDP